MAPQLKNDTAARILAELKKGPQRTSVLAVELAVTEATIRRWCRELEEDGQLVATQVAGRGPMFCLDEQKAVDRFKYDGCVAEGHELRPIPNTHVVWSLKSG